MKLKLVLFLVGVSAVMFGLGWVPHRRSAERRHLRGDLSRLSEGAARRMGCIGSEVAEQCASAGTQPLQFPARPSAKAE